MSNARNAILRRIRNSLAVTADDTTRHEAARTRIAQHARHLIPERAGGGRESHLALFQSFLEGQQARVITCSKLDLVPKAINDYLATIGAHPKVRFGSEPKFAAMNWDQATGLDVANGAAEARDQTGLSYALAGIAETGTLVIAAGADNPVTLAFVPANHIIVVDRDRIVGSYEDVIDLVREAFGPTGMPRTLNYISGPSRTADIGGKIVIGAHGPRNLAVIIIG